LSQEELARLLGKASHSAISRYEQQGVIPPLRTLIGYEVVFGLGLKSMIPALYREIEEDVISRGSTLWNELEGRIDHGAVQKRELLLDMIRRASAEPPAA
jgi:transcriptional regulator with XRE-family HTH domain